MHTRVIDLLGQYQNNSYSLVYFGGMAKFLDSMSSIPPEKELFEISLQREPRGAQKSQIF